MKIGIIGYYGYDNYGDDRMLYSIKRFFQFADFLVIGGWDDALRNLEAINRCDYVLFGGGGIILRDTYGYADLIDLIKVPMSFIGISVEANHDKMRGFFDIILSKSDVVIVRDAQSKSAFNNHEKVIVGPDLTFLYPLEIADEEKDEVCGLSLRDWYYWKADLYSDYWKIMSNLDNKYAWLKKIYPFKKWSPDSVVDIVEKEFSNIIPIPFDFNKGKKNDYTLMRQYFADVPNQFIEENYMRIRYIVGMRFHSLVFAVQSGIPFVSLTYQPKNESFCTDIGLEYLSQDIYDLHSFRERIGKMKRNHKEIRKKLIDYRYYCSENITNIMMDFKRNYIKN